MTLVGTSVIVAMEAIVPSSVNVCYLSVSTACLCSMTLRVSLGILFCVGPFFVEGTHVEVFLLGDCACSFRVFRCSVM